MSDSPNTPAQALERDPLKLFDKLIEETGSYGVDVATSPTHELAPRASWAAAAKAVRARIEELVEAVDLAWGLIANAGTHSGRGWAGEGPEWQEAAIKWRDTRYLGSQRNPRRPRELDIVMGGQADRLEPESGDVPRGTRALPPLDVVDDRPATDPESAAALAAQDAALEPHDPTARRRDRAPWLPKVPPDSPHSIDGRAE